MATSRIILILNGDLAYFPILNVNTGIQFITKWLFADAKYTHFDMSFLSFTQLMHFVVFASNIHWHISYHIHQLSPVWIPDKHNLIPDMAA